MHEATFARAILEQLDQRRESGQITGKIDKVFLEIGRLSTIVPENLTFIFSILSGEYGCAGAELEIDMIPITCLCENCARQFQINELEFHCPSCESPKVKIMTGRELIIKGVEISDDNQENRDSHQNP